MALMSASCAAITNGNAAPIMAVMIFLIVKFSLVI